MSFDEDIDENENRDENECIDESENRDKNINESKNTDENEGIYESKNTDESENIDENENVNIVFENDQQKENYVILALRQWALAGGIISMSKIDELLAKLQPVFNNLPKSYKTLLKTDDDIHITHFENGGQF
ncbi:hypothetical protein RF55_18030 [Lasius niger]|uniref:Uncharacterized protein n=1 Tax=Lasius niger TaxID=67767 RepID=A0A0J7K1X2_LASNI|nr:hypothetical protein RF55_18030 [Lasius niger]